MLECDREDYVLNDEECKYLLLKVVEQAVRDYCSLEWSDVPYRNFYWQNAKDFLFEEDYFIQWGDLELNLDGIGEVIELDSDWFRRKAKDKYEKEQRKGKRKKG